MIEPLPVPAVDESRRGILTINEGGMAALLGLKPDHRIEEFRVTSAGNLQVEIVGADMPEGFAPKPVVLLVQQRTVGDPGGSRREHWASWEHLPERSWRLR